MALVCNYCPYLAVCFRITYFRGQQRFKNVEITYNLGQNKIEQQTRTPPPPNQGWSRAKGKNAPFSHLWLWGEGGVGFPFILSKIVAYGFITSVPLPPPPAPPPGSQVIELQKRKISTNVDIAIEPDMDFSYGLLWSNTCSDLSIQRTVWMFRPSRRKFRKKHCTVHVLRTEVTWWYIYYNTLLIQRKT